MKTLLIATALLLPSTAFAASATDCTPYSGNWDNAPTVTCGPLYNGPSAATQAPIGTPKKIVKPTIPAL